MLLYVISCVRVVFNCIIILLLSVYISIGLDILLITCPPALLMFLKDRMPLTESQSLVIIHYITDLM